MEDKKKGLPISVVSDKCVGCLTCELRCSLRRVKAFNPAKADIRVRRVPGKDVEFQISFTDDCDRCGVCARYCLYGALVQPKREGRAG